MRTEPLVVDRRHQTRLELPPSKGKDHRVLAPALRDVERNLVVIMGQPDAWHLVDEFVGRTSTASPMRQALWRRGAEVRQIQSALDNRVVQVWARWPHAVPTTPAPWELPL